MLDFCFRRNFANSNIVLITSSSLSLTHILRQQAKQSSSHHADLQTFVSESLSRIRADAISRLILGSCGKYDFMLIEDVAELLSLLLRTTSVSEAEPHLVSSLREDHFLLGDPAKNVALTVLTRSGAVELNPISPSDLAVFLQEVWKLHRVEDTDALPASDEVARFLQRFS